MNQTRDLAASLKTHFNYNDFRIGQREIIEEILDGNDVLGILPTGSGKSLCYQLLATLLPGTTIVVSPLISLMIDQVKELKAIKFKEVIALNSFMEYAERRRVYQNLGKYKLVYISPELLQQEEIKMLLQQITISLFVIDEAHCISQWGHEFRPDYLRLANIIKLLQNPPVLALSATATVSVQKDIMQSLKRPNMVKHIFPMDRENIAFCIKDVKGDEEKLSSMVELLSHYHTPTLIYFSSRRATEIIASVLAGKVPNRRIAFYHGGMEQMDRITIQQQFMNDQLDIICCTSAFGMGINKNNIRLVIHYHFPAQLESYIQEVGRAGRDGGASVSVLFYSRQDEYLPATLIHNELPTDKEILFVFQQLQRYIQLKEPLPTDMDELEREFKLNETQWRFIYAQLENNGIIKNNRLLVNHKRWQEIIKVIINYRKKRLLLKQGKLNEIIQWMNSTACLRKDLYKQFQHSYRQPSNQCCSNCGFTFGQWKPVQTTVKRDFDMTWEEKLKYLLLE